MMDGWMDIIPRMKGPHRGSIRVLGYGIVELEFGFESEGFWGEM